MTKKKEVSSALREQKSGLYKGNNSVLKIANTLSLPKSTIQYITKRWENSGNTKNIPRSGRPRKITERGLRKLRKVVKEIDFLTLRR